MRTLEGQTALLHASWRGNTNLVKLLIDYGADLNAYDFENSDLLHLAANMEVFKMGVALGLDMHRKTAYGRSPIHGCLIFSNWASFLLNTDGDIDASNAFVWKGFQG